MEREGGRWGTKGGREQDIQNQNLKILTLSAPPLSLLLFGPLLHLIERKNGVPVGVPLCDSRSAVAVRGGGKSEDELPERLLGTMAFVHFDPDPDKSPLIRTVSAEAP